MVGSVGGSVEGSVEELRGFCERSLEIFGGSVKDL